MASRRNESESPALEGLGFEVAPGLDAMAERDDIEDLSLAHQEVHSRADDERDEVEDHVPTSAHAEVEDAADIDEVIEQHSVDEVVEAEEDQDQFDEKLLVDLKQQGYLKRKNFTPNINSIQIIENSKIGGSDEKGHGDQIGDHRPSSLSHSSSSSSNSNDHPPHDGGESDIVFSESRCSTTVTRVRTHIDVPLIVIVMIQLLFSETHVPGFDFLIILF